MRTNILRIIFAMSGFSIFPSIAQTEAVKPSKPEVGLKIGSGLPPGKPIDIFGVYPGMGATEAGEIILHYREDARNQNAWWRKTRVGETNEYTWIHRVGVDDPRNNDADSLTAWFSGPSAGGQVISASRFILYPEGKEPSFDDTLNAIKQKYGATTYEKIDTKYTQYEWRFRKGTKLKDGDEDPCNRNLNLTPFLGAIGKGTSAVADSLKTPDQILLETIQNNSSGDRCGLILKVNLTRASDPERLRTLNAAFTDYPRIQNLKEVIEYNSSQNEIKKRESPKAPTPRL